MTDIPCYQPPFPPCQSDVLSYPNFAGFPASGVNDKIYVDKATGKTYFWDGITYQPTISNTSITINTDSITDQFVMIDTATGQLKKLNKIFHTQSVDLDTTVFSGGSIAVNPTSILSGGVYNFSGTIPIATITPLNPAPTGYEWRSNIRLQLSRRSTAVTEQGKMNVYLNTPTIDINSAGNNINFVSTGAQFNDDISSSIGTVVPNTGLSLGVSYVYQQSIGSGPNWGVQNFFGGKLSTYLYLVKL